MNASQEPLRIYPQVDARTIAEVLREAEEDPRSIRERLAALPTWRMSMKAPSTGWLTANGRLHHLSRASRTKVLRRSAYLHARSAKAPQLSTARIVVVFHHRDRRRRDVANLAPTAKAVIDGLVDAGLLPDDDDAHLTGPDLRTGEPVAHGQWPELTVLVYPRSTP